MNHEPIPDENEDARVAGDGFVRDKFAWINQVKRDRELPLFALHVALSLMESFNRRSGLAFPHQITIATELGASRNAVGNAISHLARKNHIEVVPSSNRRGGNRYRMILQSPKRDGRHANGGGHETPDLMPTAVGMKTDLMPTAVGMKTDLMPTAVGMSMPTAVGTNNPLKEPIEYIPPETASRSLPPKGPKPRCRRETRISDDWSPQPKDVIHAAELGFTEADIRDQAERFRDHWLAEAGPRARKNDWSAAWRKWCRDAPNHRTSAPSLLLPINGGRHSGPAIGQTVSRPKTGGASGQAGVRAFFNHHRENRR